MTHAQRNQWVRLAVVVRNACAASDAPACGFIDNHGDSLGDPVKAGDRLATSSSRPRRWQRSCVRNAMGCKLVSVVGCCLSENRERFERERGA